MTVNFGVKIFGCGSLPKWFRTEIYRKNIL